MEEEVDWGEGDGYSDDCLSLGGDDIDGKHRFGRAFRHGRRVTADKV